MAERIHLRWYHTFLFLLQAILTVVDIGTDISTCKLYWEHNHKLRFAICLSLIILPMFVTCIWSVVASTNRALNRDNDEVSQRETLAGLDSLKVNICLSFSCFGPTLHSLKLFLFCAKNFRSLWEAKGGRKVSKEDGDLYYLYIHNLNMKLVEGLLESGPQLFLQFYTMINQTEDIEELQVVSVSMSFLCITHTITSSEVVREYSGIELHFWHSALIFVANGALMMGRAGAFVFFAVVERWWLALVVSAHWLVAIVIGFILWNSKRTQHFFVFLFCHSYKYLFVFRSSALRSMRSADKPIPKPTEYFVIVFWYFLFAAENTAMIVAYYYLKGGKHPEKSLMHGCDLYSVVALAVVLGGTYGGMIMKSLLWCCCFKHPVQDDEAQVSRPPTMLIRDQGIRIQTIERIKL